MAEAQVVDSTIGSLPAASSLDDASLLVVEQQGAAMHITGAQIKGYAQDSVSGYVGQAQEAVEEAQQASQQALEAVGQIGTSVQEAQQAAQQAQDSAESVQGVVSEAEAARDQYPRPENGVWQVYNPATGAYESSGEPSVGPAGPTGATGASMETIRLVSGNHAPGSTDTYEVVLTNGETAGQFQVYNGEDGSGGTTEPLSLTGFQPDPADPTGMTMTLQLTDEQYASVVSCQNDGTPIYIEGAFLVYPIGRTSESPDFSSVPTSSGSYCRLYVNYDSKLASFYPFIPMSVSAQDAGIFSSLDTPKQDASGVYVYGFNNNMPIYVYYPSLVGGEKIILYPDSRPNSTTYVFANSTYRLTFDTSSSTATLSLIDTVTEDYVTNAINTAIGAALEASY